MPAYPLPDDREVLVYYAGVLKDRDSRTILHRGVVRNREEALQLAEFCWNAYRHSAAETEVSGQPKTAIQSVHEYVFLNLIDAMFTCFDLAEREDSRQGG